MGLERNRKFAVAPRYRLSKSWIWKSHLKLIRSSGCDHLQYGARPSAWPHQSLLPVAFSSDFQAAPPQKDWAVSTAIMGAYLCQTSRSTRWQTARSGVVSIWQSFRAVMRERNNSMVCTGRSRVRRLSSSRRVTVLIHKATVTLGSTLAFWHSVCFSSDSPSRHAFLTGPRSSIAG